MVVPMGLALIGLGDLWGRQLAAAIQRSPATRLVTCFARSPGRRGAFAAEFGCQASTSLEDALSTKGVEGAVIATPAHTHTSIVLTCARHRIHALVEKPMALHLGEGLRMAGVFQQAGLVLAVDHEMRRLGSSRAMKQVVESGTLGHVVSAVASLTLQGTFQPDNWRCHRDTNRGGALMQLGIHQIDNLIYLLGPVVEVQGRVAHVSAPADVDDVGLAQMRFESGALAHVMASYVSPKAYDLRLFGDQGNLVCEADMRIWPDAIRVDSVTRLETHTRAGRRPVAIEPRDVLSEVMADFAASARGERSPETGAREGLAALAVVEAALRSSDHGTPVDPQALFQDAGGDS